MPNATADLLTTLLERGERNIGDIDSHIASEVPNTSDQLLLLRNIQHTYVKVCQQLREALREYE
jgi:hypothetical protein